jgi:hypothetical protein
VRPNVDFVPGSWLRGGVALVGVVSLLLAVGMAFLPGLVPTGPLEALFGSSALVLSSVWVVAIALAGMTVYRALEDDHARPSVSLPTLPSDADPDRSEVDTAGDRVDARLAKVRGDATVKSRVEIAISKKRVRERVRELAVDVITDTESCSGRTAHEKLDRGIWTDRPRARVFLGGPDVPDLPLGTRIRDWASGEAFERQVRAALEELAEMAGVDAGESLAPDPVGLDETVGEPDWWTSAGAGAGLEPELDLRSADAFESTGLYRREMFTASGDVAELDLDGPSTVSPDSESEPERNAEASDPDVERSRPTTDGSEPLETSGEVLETGGERT